MSAANAVANREIAPDLAKELSAESNLFAEAAAALESHTLVGRDKVQLWRDNCEKYEREHKKDGNTDGAAFYVGAKSAYQRVLDEA